MWFFVWCILCQRNGGLNSGPKSANIVTDSSLTQTQRLIKMLTSDGHWDRIGRSSTYGRAPNTRHFIRFLNVPSKHWHRANLFIRLSEKPPNFVAFYDTLGIRKTHSRLNSLGPHRGRQTDRWMVNITPLTGIWNWFAIWTKIKVGVEISF